MYPAKFTRKVIKTIQNIHDFLITAGFSSMSLLQTYSIANG